MDKIKSRTICLSSEPHDAFKPALLAWYFPPNAKDEIHHRLKNYCAGSKKKQLGLKIGNFRCCKQTENCQAVKRGAKNDAGDYEGCKSVIYSTTTAVKLNKPLFENAESTVHFIAMTTIPNIQNARTNLIIERPAKFARYFRADEIGGKSSSFKLVRTAAVYCDAVLHIRL